MPHIRWRHNSARLILPAVVLPPHYAGNASDAVRTDALIDTGATSSGLRLDVARTLGLPAKGTKRVLTANGMLMAEEYLFRVGLVVGDYLDPSFDPGTQLPFVLDRGVMGFGLEIGFPYALLIGMDVIGSGNLTVRKDGTALFEF
jgi:Aspartyl protease